MIAQLQTQEQRLDLIPQIVEILCVDRENVKAARAAITKVRDHRRKWFNVFRKAGVGKPWTVDFCVYRRGINSQPATPSI